MRKDILNFYLKTSMYTNCLPFKEYYMTLPNDIEKLSRLLSQQIIHKNKLVRSYKNKPRKYEDECELKKIKQEYPWYRNRCDDDLLLTAPAITAELFRQDPRGFVMDREIKDKIVITCRYVSVLLASILKAKGIPARCRSGYANYFSSNSDVYYDHWIVQYYDTKVNRWINVDATDIYKLEFNQYDIPTSKIKLPAEIWLDVRNKKDDERNYFHGTHLNGLNNLAHALFFDFHSIMNDEISYLFLPTFFDTKDKWNNLTEKELKKIDELAYLMLDIEKNFDKLKFLFRNDRWLRIINMPLVKDSFHLELDN